MNPKPLKIALIGLGNLAHSLLPALKLAGMEVVQLISRNEKQLTHYQELYEVPDISPHLTKLRKDLDLVFLCLPDAVIGPIAEELAPIAPENTVFVHTSGSIALEALKPLGKQIGVFYPMQIFTQSALTSFAELPIFLEGDKEVFSKLHQLANKMSSKVYTLDSRDRLRLHMGAVMVCNFSNYLYRMAQEHLPKVEGLDFSMYEPLIREHIDKVFSYGPENSQTGPAIRKDLPTILKHLELLEEKQLHQDLYWEMSKLIRPDLEL